MISPTMIAFSVGDVVRLPVWPRGHVEGEIRALDVKKGRIRWCGLAVVSADGSCWEFRPELARPAKKESP